MLKRKQKKTKKEISNNSYNANRSEWEWQGRNLGTHVYNQMMKGVPYYKQENAFKHKMNNYIDLPTKSEVECYGNQYVKENGFIVQGNVYGNQGYSDKKDIFGNNESEHARNTHITLNIHKKPGEIKY